MKVLTNIDIKRKYQEAQGIQSVEAIQSGISDKLLKEKEEKSTKLVIKGGRFKKGIKTKK